jgi:hypothetical protein
MIALPPFPYDDEQVPQRRVWRLWPLDGPPLLLKRYVHAREYHVEICNLRFYNAVARASTPRLVACDDAATALLIEDGEGPTLATTEQLGPLTAQRTWERVLVALATLHARANRQIPLLRRLYAPQWPTLMAAPAVDLLETCFDALTALLRQPPLSVGERGVLIAAGSWLHARLNVAIAHHRAPVVGLASGHGVVATADRVMFMELSRPVLGLQPYDVLCTWRCDDRRTLIAQCYLAERARLGAPVSADLFWELDAALMVAACAGRLRWLAGHDEPADGACAHPLRDTCHALEKAAREVDELRALAEVVERRGLQ